MNIRGINVVILCKDREAFDPIETHLAYKGVNVKLVTTVEQVLEVLEANEPQYCIVSINHPDTNARKLMGILQGSEVMCLPAGEENNAETIKMLDDIGVEHNLYPPLNGPRTETLLQYLEKVRRQRQTVNTVDYTKESKEHDEQQIKVDKIDLKEAINELSHEISRTSAPVQAPPSEDDKMELLQKAIAFENGEEPPEPAAEDKEEAVVDIWHIFDEAMHGMENCNPVKDPAYLESTSQFLAMSLQSENYPGYIFAAIEGADDPEVTSVYEKVESLLVEMVEQFTKESISIQKVKLELRPFDFKQWIQSLKGSVQSFEVEGTVISWAYVDQQPKPVKMKESADGNFLSVMLEDIKPDTKLPHDLYLYLPKNNKYLVYTKEGFGMDTKQYEKLNDQQVQEMHLKKNDADKFKNYKFEKDVTELVEESGAEIKKAS